MPFIQVRYKKNVCTCTGAGESWSPATQGNGTTFQSCARYGGSLLGQVALRRATAVQTKAESEATVQSASSEPGSTESSSLTGQCRLQRVLESLRLFTFTYSCTESRFTHPSRGWTHPTATTPFFKDRLCSTSESTCLAGSLHKNWPRHVCRPISESAG